MSLMSILILLQYKYGVVKEDFHAGTVIIRGEFDTDIGLMTVTSVFDPTGVTVVSIQLF